MRSCFKNGYGPYMERDRCLFELGINTGGRISELLSLTVGQVFQYDRVADRLELVKTKGGRPRAIPLNSQAQEAISAYLRWKEAQGEPLNPEAPLFRSQKGSRMTRQAAHFRLKILFVRARLQGKVTTHSLRKTFGTRLRERGAICALFKSCWGIRAWRPPSATSDNALTFTAQGQGIASTQLQVYNLAGQEVFDSGLVEGPTFEWHLLNDGGGVVANGVYLYVVIVRGYDGRVIKSEVRKLVVLR